METYGSLSLGILSSLTVGSVSLPTFLSQHAGEPEAQIEASNLLIRC